MVLAVIDVIHMRKAIPKNQLLEPKNVSPFPRVVFQVQKLLVFRGHNPQTRHLILLLEVRLFFSVQPFESPKPPNIPHGAATLVVVNGVK